MRHLPFTWAAILAVLALLFGQQARAESHVELILDASGSMFNKLADGRYRIVAAKDVLTQLIAALPASEDLNVGLRVYGSELRAADPSSCEDSRLFVPIAGVERQALLDTVRNTQARGSTPIAYSLERAAEDLSGRAGTRVVVLITDGLEACGGDVRGAAEALKAAGIDLRIIGFDLDPRSAASFDGLGTFENAASAAELLSALNRAVEAAAPVKESPTYLVKVSLTRDGEPVADGATVTLVPSLADLASGERLTAGQSGAFEGRLPAGTYTAHLADAFADEPVVVTGLMVLPDAPNVFTFELAPQLTVTLTPETDTPASGATLTVAWEGAPSAGGYLELGVEGEDVNLLSLSAPGDSGEREVRLPLVTGELELRFVIEGPDSTWPVVGRAVIDLQEVTASLEAADQAVGGSVLEVSWTGPDNEQDYVTVVPADAPEGTWRSFTYTSTGNPVMLQLPDAAGEYELRYLDGYQDETLARRSLTIVAGSASFTAPSSVVAGTLVEVEVLTATGNESDYVAVVEAGAEDGTWLRYVDTPGPGTYLLVMPDVPGDYELRYMTGGEDRTLASRPLTATVATASVKAPASVGVEEYFDVVWEGADGDGDFVTIVPVGTPEGEWGYSLNTSGGNPLTLYAPEEPGDYEVRYVTGQSGFTLATWPIKVK